MSAKLHKRREDRQLVPVYVECKACGKLATARAQVNYRPGWSGAIGRLEFELLECPPGWSLMADRFGYAKASGSCGDCSAKR